MRTLFSLAICLILTACGTKLPYISADKSELTEIACFYPFSYIEFIETGNQTKYNDSLSREAEMLHRNILENHSKTFRITARIPLADEQNQASLEDEVNMLISRITQSKGLKQQAIPATMDSLLKTSGKRFGLITVNTGFSRIKGNYGRQVAANVALGVITGVLTGISWYQVPTKASSTVYTMIDDSMKGEIVFFDHSTVEANPLDDGVIEKQLTKLINHCFY